MLQLFEFFSNDVRSSFHPSCDINSENVVLLRAPYMHTQKRILFSYPIASA